MSSQDWKEVMLVIADQLGLPEESIFKELSERIELKIRDGSTIEIELENLKNEIMRKGMSNA